jgi:hypothetical protein
MSDRWINTILVEDHQQRLVEYPSMEISRRVGGVRRSKMAVELARYGTVARHRVSEEGFRIALASGSRLVGAHLVHPLTVSRRRGRTFHAAGVELAYETTRYNNSWLNERTVEISLARHILGVRRPRSVLEVGNVLRNYRLTELQGVEHTIIDRYEEIGDVLNTDVRTFRIGRLYETVVSVSTLEHVGYDEPDKDADGAVRGLETMRHHLANDGVMLVTVPLGYNAGLDAAVAEGRFACPEQFCLRRTTKDNRWIQDDVQSGLALSYGSKFRNANAIYVGLQHGRRTN